LDRISNDIELRRWLPIPRAMPDEVVAQCLEPFIPIDIVRDAQGRCFVVYYAHSYDISEFRRKVDTWQAEHDRLEGERRSKEREAYWAKKLATMDLTEPEPDEFWVARRTL
jgi:hypothetical protein